MTYNGMTVDKKALPGDYDAFEQVSCDWWTPGHVTSILPLIGAGAQQVRPGRERQVRPGHAVQAAEQERGALHRGHSGGEYR